MRIAALTYRIASGHRHTIFTRWLLLSAQLERRAIFILFFLFVRIPDFFEAVLTDGVFNQADLVFGDFRVYARSDQLHRKKTGAARRFFPLSHVPYRSCAGIRLCL